MHGKMIAVFTVLISRLILDYEMYSTDCKKLTGSTREIVGFT